LFIELYCHHYLLNRMNLVSTKGEKKQEEALTFRRYGDGEGDGTGLGVGKYNKDVVQSGVADICPVYVHRTPPCQASCPSGHDIRGWLSIVRGLDKPTDDTSWQEYAFQRMISSNPFPSVMGRVCPAPCEDGCNRNEVEETVGINAVEQYVGDWALQNNAAFPKPGPDTGKKVAIVGGGCAGLTAFIPTVSSTSFRLQPSSQGAGQTRPITEGKGLDEIMR
jgi:hypothetical protein